MGACCSSQMIQPVELSSPDEFHGPVSGRNTTDIIGTILLVSFSVVLFGLVGYCAYYGDIYRVIYGYDNCGNICGRITPPETDPMFSCKGADYTDKKYLMIKGMDTITFSFKNVQKECVKDCSIYPNYETFLHRCIPIKTKDSVNTVVSKSGLKDFFHEVSEDLHHTSYDILGLCFIALILSIVLVLSLKFFAAFMVWFILIGTLGLSIIGTIYIWILWIQKADDHNSENDIDKRKATTYLVVAIFATSVTVIMFLVIIVLRKRIKLVIELFIEAGKAITRMPLLLIQPLLTVGALALCVTLWLYFTILIQSAGHLASAQPSYYYQKDIVMKLTRWYNLFGLFWITQFCIGCQHMIIAGAVATWFFTRDKSTLKSPISKSAYNLTRYHLGSVALGSLFLALFQLLRTIIKALENYTKARSNYVVLILFKLIQCCLSFCENILMYITRNAYIEIAIFGQPFCTSGKHAFKVLVNNALRVTAINTVGDFVLILAKILVIIVSVSIGIFFIGEKEGVHHIWAPLLLVALFAYLVAHCFFTVYEMVIDTIFICFCEDCEINDGINKPYFMSRNLMEFVNNSKKVLQVGDTISETPLKDV